MANKTIGRDFGLRRYSTHEYGSIALEALICGTRYSIEKRRGWDAEVCYT